MKILYFYESLPIGGAEMIITNYLVELSRRGHKVFLVEKFKTKSFLYDKLISNGVQIFTLYSGAIGRINYRLLYGLIGYKKLNSVIKIINPDVVHVHTYSRVVDKLAIPMDRLFFTFHTQVKRALQYSEKGFLGAARRASAQGMRFVAISKDIKTDLQRIIPDAQITVIPNGLDIKAIKQEKYDRQVFLSQLGIKEDAFIIGHVGRFHPVKNHSKLIRVFAQVLSRKKNAYLFLVGTGTEQEQLTIKNLLQEYRVEQNTIMFGVRQDAAKIMSVFDAFVLPSKVEGFPLVAVEAQAHNVRSIFSTGVPAEVVRNENAFRLDLNESDEKWAEYILSDFIHKPVGDINDFSLDKVIDSHLELYAQVKNGK